MTTTTKIEIVACPDCGQIVKNTVVALSLGDDHSSAQCICGWWAVDETFPVLGYSQVEGNMLDPITEEEETEYELYCEEMAAEHNAWRERNPIQVMDSEL